jgi:hypothetical protein
VATLILSIHLAWIIWLITGAFWTRGRPLLAVFHLLSLVWGIVTELELWPCPLTLAEQFFENRAGVNEYSGGFLLHYLDRIVYPDIPDWLISVIGVTVCVLNLGVYGRRYWRRKR